MSELKEIRNLKEFSTSLERFEGGHRLCPGCSHSVIVREVLNCNNYDLAVSAATGCLEVCTAIYPFTSWDVNWIHVGFENAAAAISGVEAMHKVLARKNRLYTDGKKKAKFIAFGGDGGTYDIGFQSLSGAFERGHEMLYICLDNEGYMNTGGQRSSSTPIGGATTTSPAGKASYGEKRTKKDITQIMAAHNSPYVATVLPSQWKDLVRKTQKALATEGPTFINALSPCPTEWKFDPARSMEISELAADTLVFPLYEIENNRKLTITYRPKKVLPVRDYLGAQGRFRHLFTKENEHIIEQWQKNVNEYWEWLQRREEASV
ncbi:MAG: pyruvate ferredoxin oxidoreductase [Campylobacterales bacterium]